MIKFLIDEFLKNNYLNYLNNSTFSSIPIKKTPTLEDFHITTKKDWINFLRNYHPDKIQEDSDIETCSDDIALVIKLGKEKGW